MELALKIVEKVCIQLDLQWLSDSLSIFSYIELLLVILENCKFGNLHDYLVHNRELFVNGLDDHGDLQSTQNNDKY